MNKTKILTFQKTFSPTPMLFYDHKPLTETKEYNFLRTVIDHKGYFKRGIQELSKNGLKVLFCLRILNNYLSTSHVNSLTR
jgi:hypothetical protein